ncbi:hypothetical protein [Streptomyces sp. NBRC 109706]|uniref:hypothetical protein n=1 Tax=Streptomyces sp. NBRC 109706 TaxID=1550035 RepID=UPI0007831988|nr:hypothetical protein [Streptomyces sp. NBRC 109706]
MDTTPWRQRVRAEDELLEQLRLQVSQSAKRREDALAEGVAELGSVYAVAKELRRSWQAIDKALKRRQNRPKQEPTTTE